jgi:hypothetical protein
MAAITSHITRRWGGCGTYPGYSPDWVPDWVPVEYAVNGGEYGGAGSPAGDLPHGDGAAPGYGTAAVGNSALQRGQVVFTGSASKPQDKQRIGSPRGVQAIGRTRMTPA